MNPEKNIYAPFVVEFISVCMRHIRDATQKMEVYAGVPVTMENAADMSALRGQVVAPLSFLLLVHSYPVVIKAIAGDENAWAPKIFELKSYTNHLADEISQATGLPKEVVIESPRIIENTDPFQAYTVSTLDMTVKIIKACRAEIDAVPEIRTGQDVIKVYGSNSVLSATLACVHVITQAPDMLVTIGEDAMTLREDILQTNDFVQQTLNRVIRAIQPQ